MGRPWAALRHVHHLLHQPLGEHIGDFGDVAGIQMDMRITRWVNIAERPIDDLGYFEFRYELRSLQEPGRADGPLGGFSHGVEDVRHLRR